MINKVIIFSLIFIFEVHATTQNFETIRIEGNQKSNKQITSALNLLKQKSTDKYQLVKSSINTIKQSEKNQVEFEKYPSILEISYEGASHSVTWFATTLLHYALQADQVQIDSNHWNSPKNLSRNIKTLTQTLIKIGAPENEIKILRSLNETAIDDNIYNEIYQNKDFDKISVQGDLKFTQQIISALKILKLNSPNNYSYVNNYTWLCT